MVLRTFFSLIVFAEHVLLIDSKELESLKKTIFGIPVFQKNRKPPGSVMIRLNIHAFINQRVHDLSTGLCPANFLEHGMDERNAASQTALHVAMSVRKEDSVKALIEAKADMNT